MNADLAVRFFEFTMAPFIAIAFRLLLKPGVYEFDHGKENAAGTFYPMLIIYERMYRMILVIDLIGMCLSIRVRDSVAGWAFFCSFAASTLFVILLTLYYEFYMKSRYPRNLVAGVSNYTLDRYSTILGLGFSSVINLLIGVFVIACRFL